MKKKDIKISVLIGISSKEHQDFLDTTSIHELVRKRP